MSIPFWSHIPSGGLWFGVGGGLINMRVHDEGMSSEAGLPHGSTSHPRGQTNQQKTGA